MAEIELPTPEMMVEHLDGQVHTLLRENERLRAERDDARKQRRKWQEASAEDRAENQRLLAALNKITKTPIMPFPDPIAHSWHAFATAVHRAWNDQVNTARGALAGTDTSGKGSST